MANRLLCDACVSDCGSVVVRSTGRRDSTRERYFSSLVSDELKDGCPSGLFAVLSLSSNESKGSAIRHRSHRFASNVGV